MMSRNHKKTVLCITRWVLYILLSLVLNAIFTTTSGNAKPLIFIPLIIVLSMYQNELISGIIGAAYGLLMDVSMGKLIGMNALLMIIIAVVSSLLFLHLMKKNILNMMIITFSATIIQGLFYYFFYYKLWDIENRTIVFKDVILISMLYTLITAPFIYFLIKLINKIRVKEHLVVEEDTSSDREYGG